MNNREMDGELWDKLVVASSLYLEERKQAVDALNVFPVPDGDTGTNMSLTMASAARAIEQKKEKAIGRAAQTVSYGALMGARGNSGVILSQLLAGFASYAEGKERLDIAGFSLALESAVQTAYQAVMNPVEGTILTVSKEMAISAQKEAKKSDATLESVIEAAYRGAVFALEKTPEMLPVLKQAGVVDAGGKGLVFILEGMLRYLKGESFDLAAIPEAVVKREAAREYAEELLEYEYCTEFILKKKEKDLSLGDIRSFLADKGDCLLVVGNPETGKIHIHTNTPGVVLDFCTSLGSLHDIQIHNMSEQSKEMQGKARAVKHMGIISVASGTGINEIFKSLGVDEVIAGGQTMNPSTQDFIEAIDSTLAEEVIILPNNSNIFLAAQQAANVSSKPCTVINTKTIPQGIAALMAYNPENDLEHNKEKMEEAVTNIITLEITYAVRDSQYDGISIKKGQILGIADGKISYAGTAVDEVIAKMAPRLIQPSHELITVYYGEDVTENEAREMLEKLSRQYPDIDFELHYGGQPLYYYLISIE